MAPGEDFHARLHFGTDWRGNDREELLSDLAERDTWAKACHNEYTIRQVVLAVVGMPRSGKSTFIQHALDLKKTPSSKVATKRVSLEGTVSILEIHEFDMHEIEINSDGTPHWPENAADDITGKVNGVLVIYSIEDIASTKPIPTVLRTAMPSSPSKRPRTSSDTKDLGSPPFSEDEDAKSKHQRAQTEVPCRTSEIGRDTRLKEEKHVGRASYDSQNESLEKRTDSASFINTCEEMQSSLGATVQSQQPEVYSSSPTSTGVLGSQASLTLPDPIDQGDPFWRYASYDQQRVTEEDMSDQKSEPVKMQRDENNVSGVGFDELVDRLLSQATSKIEMKFAAVFLCLYRRFISPSVLLDAIISRFDSLSPNTSHQTTRITSQLRYLNVLAQWITEYPGDFAHSLTRVKMIKFVSALADQRPFAMAVQEFHNQLDVVCEDDDTAWACSDVSRSKTSTVEQLRDPISIWGASLAAQSSTKDEEDSGQKASRVLKRGSAASSTSSSNDKPSSRSTISSKAVPDAVESAQRQAPLLTPSPRTNLCKIHWNLFIDSSDEDIAQELTRIDWVLFSSIRPRDLVRHVSLREEDKENCKSLQYVSKMIHQFNHVAFWTANMVLLREKPKHRAKALEKFMSIAWKLRQLNNYNSLGAVVAGINATAVHRLVQTRELVPYDVQKQFMRLEILMGTQKSHFAYRLAWSNTPMERIPFLPLLCRDLASAEEGNPTYVDEGRKLINWKKFEIIGDVVISIQRSQATPYHFTSWNEEAQRLILECKINKDDDVCSPQAACA
ncbi:MAG: hypothetical protein Q9188_005159 [Gyalolechia gomerana]